MSEYLPYPGYDAPYNQPSNGCVECETELGELIWTDYRYGEQEPFCKECFEKLMGTDE